MSSSSRLRQLVVVEKGFTTMTCLSSVVHYKRSKQVIFLFCISSFSSHSVNLFHATQLSIFNCSAYLSLYFFTSFSRSDMISTLLMPSFSPSALNYPEQTKAPQINQTPKPPNPNKSTNAFSFFFCFSFTRFFVIQSLSCFQPIL